MAVECEFEDRPNYLFVRAAGQDESTDQNFAFAKFVREEAGKRGYDRILIDEREIIYLTNSETSVVAMLFELANIFAETNLFSAITHIAIISPRGHEENVEFAETVFRNRGLNVRYFYEQAPAEAWIVE
jgi:hypothetical protein